LTEASVCPPLPPQAVKAHGSAAAKSGQERTLLKFQSAEDLEPWERLDDVIMGGKSSSSFELADGYAEYRGELVRPVTGGCRNINCLQPRLERRDPCSSFPPRLSSKTGRFMRVICIVRQVVEDGGFCGTRASDLNLDLSGFDGIRLRVQGDGNRYKLNLKTNEREAPESVYQVRRRAVPSVLELPVGRGAFSALWGGEAWFGSRLPPGMLVPGIGGLRHGGGRLDDGGPALQPLRPRHPTERQLQGRWQCALESYR
jgi:hypothetical protein